MSQKAFQKFIEQKESGAKKKERIRQEKKKARKETQEYFEQKKKQKREGKPNGTADSGDRDTGFRARGPEAAPSGTGKRKTATKKQSAPSRNRKSGPDGRKPEHRHAKPVAAGPQPETKNRKPGTANAKKSSANKQPGTAGRNPETGSHAAAPMPLNKFIAHAGICSRRDAAELVKAGKVTVDGQKITEPGFKVTEKAEVTVQGKKIALRKNFVYILLNKPKDYITTTEDPQGRKTVLDIVKRAGPERVYPVGRLDRNTTGVLLLTNDGELAQKLAHPSYEIKKIYEVKLDKPLIKKDFDAILKGLALEDGFIAPDSLAYADAKDRSVVGVEIHSGRNRIVRRIFEHLGYDVRGLDRVMYANLTKKNVERGKWRFLTEKEIRLLKYMNASFTKR